VEAGRLQINRGIDRSGLLPAAVFFGLGLLGLLIWWVFGGNWHTDSSVEMFAVPYVALTTVVILAPSIYLWYRGKFNLFNPLVHAAWSYFIPSFLIGGLIYIFGLSRLNFTHLLKNPESDIIWTFLYISIGFAAMSAGYFLPVGKWAGKRVQQVLPVWDWQPRELYVPCVVLLALGSFSTALAFVSGVLGFQKGVEIGAYDGLIYLCSLMLTQGSFMLWFAIFRCSRLNFTHFVLIFIMIWLQLARAAFAGNRSSLLHAAIAVFAAYILAGRTFKLKQAAVTGSLMIIVIIIGMIYGTNFRSVKENQNKVEIGEYTEYVGRTFDKLTQSDLTVVFGEGFQAIADRLENVSSIAVVVSNYEDLEPYEASYGMDNNIYKDFVYFFIPRVLWKDKPVASDPAKYGDLYFNFSENSFAITPVGDLLRNFGPWGVPAGMLFLGIILRFIYAALIENQITTVARATLYFMLLFTVSYEGFYGVIIPYLGRVAFIAIIGLLFVWFMIPKQIKG
jgi:hypothetical protein